MDIEHQEKKRRIEPNSKHKSLCKKQVSQRGGYRTQTNKKAKQQVDNLLEAN